METINEILWPGIEDEDLLKPDGPHISVNGVCGGGGGGCACNTGQACWSSITG